MKKSILALNMILLVTMSFAQNIQKGTDKKGNFILEKGGKKIVDENFEKVGTYNSVAGLIPAKLGGKWGFYDNDGKLVIPYQYESMTFKFGERLDGWYDQDRMQVFFNGRQIYIDKTGKESSAPEYDIVMQTTHVGAGYYFKKGGKWALADKDRKVLTEFKYDRISGPIAVNPFLYRGVRDGKEYKLNIKGEEEGIIETAASSNSPSKDKTSDKCTYKCQKCDKVTQGKCNSSANGITVENCFAQQPDPKKGSKNHEWRKQ